MKIKIFLLAALALFVFSSINAQKKIKISIENNVNYSYTVTGHYGIPGGTQVSFGGTATASTTTWFDFGVPSNYVLLDIRISEPGETPVADFTSFSSTSSQDVWYPPSTHKVVDYNGYGLYGPDIYYFFEIN
jgi:hypothetical protein